MLAGVLQAISVPPGAVADAGPAGSLVYPTNTGVNYETNTSAKYQIVATGLTAAGTGDFTYDAWFQTTLPQGSAANPLTSYPNQTILGTRSNSGDGNAAIDVTVRNGVLVVMTGAGSFPLATANYTIVENQWYHFAYVRKDVSGVKTTSLYLNGNLVSSRTDFTTSQTSTQVTIGTKGQKCCANDSSEAFQGYLSNIRISNSAEYTSAFTPTGPLTATASTQILLNTTNDANKIKNSAGNAISFGITGVSGAAIPDSNSNSPFATPTLVSLTVATGTLGGGTNTTVTGTNLSSTSGITVGGTSATGVVVNSSTSVSFTTPSGTLGAKDVVVSTMLGNFSLSGAFTYEKTTQAITFGVLTDILISGTPPALSATASSGLTVAFTSATAGVCTVSGTTVTLVAPGTCTINANQAGDGTYAAAPQVQQSFGVSYRSQSISFDALAGATLGVSSAPLIRGSASSGLGVTFSSTTPGVCSVSGTIISMLNPGTCTISASQSGNATYSAAASVSQSFSITAKPDDGQKELMEILSLLPGLASISKNIGDLAVNNMTKCVKGKLVKRVKLGAKCPKGYVKRK